MAGKDTFYYWTVKREESHDRDTVNFKVDAIGKLPKLKLIDPGASKVTPKTWKALEAVLLKRKVRFDLPENIDDDDDEDED